MTAKRKSALDMLGIYGKAVVAFVTSLLGAIGSWLIVVGDAPIGRAEWGALVISLAGVIGATVGVAAVTNSDQED